MKQELLRMSDLASNKNKVGMLPVTAATIWRWVHEGRFPKPFKLSNGVTVWDCHEVDAYLAEHKTAASATGVQQ